MMIKRLKIEDRKWSERLSRIQTRVAMVANLLLLLSTVLAVLLIVYRIGFPMSADTMAMFGTGSRILIVAQWLLITLLLLTGRRNRKIDSNKMVDKVIRVMIYGLFTVVMLANISLQYGWLKSDMVLSFLTHQTVSLVTLAVVSLAEISRSITSMLGRRTSPPMILAGSFMFIILVGSLLLMTPNATTVPLSYTDSLFISTSAVCVTGLTPVDISQVLTLTGQVILLILIQIGGLGVMTITSFFGLFFASGHSFAGQMVVGDLLSTDKMSGLLRMLTSILLVTISIEGVGALLLYGSAMDSGAFTTGQAVYFGVFHAISAFCNAGFSTLKGNLADPIIAHLNTMRWVVGLLVVFGGIGFPLFSNFLHTIGHRIANSMRKLHGIRPKIRPRMWSLNSYIVVRMTLMLIIGGWVGFMIFEWDASLAHYDFWGKLSQSFFMSVTPRTAGFNGVEMTSMMPVSIILTIILMWVGGAPQSTAGGIKVTTAYVAFKNIISSNRTNNELNIHGRQIPSGSVERAFAVVILSLTIITTAVVMMAIFEPEVAVGALLFEAVSAISTVGLSLDLTPELGSASKYVLIALMFIGRVGVISILLLFLRPSSLRSKPYSYPKENILIT